MYMVTYWSLIVVQTYKELDNTSAVIWLMDVGIIWRGKKKQAIDKCKEHTCITENSLREE